ncbi:hypothetical protein BASA81_001378 [Batrachochytrium salamandrivorans]|nr:hypothetical protein BASA81_001378 [Batrachochytrium salamandrivorans]
MVRLPHRSNKSLFALVVLVVLGVWGMWGSLAVLPEAGNDLQFALERRLARNQQREREFRLSLSSTAAPMDASTLSAVAVDFLLGGQLVALGPTRPGARQFVYAPCLRPEGEGEERCPLYAEDGGKTLVERRDMDYLAGLDWVVGLRNKRQVVEVVQGRVLAPLASFAGSCSEQQQQQPDVDVVCRLLPSATSRFRRFYANRQSSLGAAVRGLANASAACLLGMDSRLERLMSTLDASCPDREFMDAYG